MTRSKPYPRYEESGISWQPRAPASWRIASLGGLYRTLDVRAGASADGSVLLSVSQTKGVVPRSTISTDAARADDLSRYKLCFPGDIVLNRMSAYKGALGVSAVHGIVSPDYMVMRVDPHVNAHFIAHFLKTPVGIAQMSSRLRGIGSADLGTVRTPRVNHADLRSIAVLVPSLREQDSIVAFLDRETAKIDSLIGKQEQLIGTLGERRAAVITHAATHGLRRSAAMSSTGNPYIGLVPQHWTVSHFGLEMAINSGLVDPQVEPWSSMILVAPNHVLSGLGKLDGRETAAEQGADSGKFVARRGQILYSKIRPSLNKVALAVEDCLCSADMYAISSLTQDDHRYLVYYMLSRPFHRFASEMSNRVKMPKINQEELSGAPWLRPPLDEQREIADYLDEQTARIDVLIQKARQFIELSWERRSALISAAVTGQIDVRGEVDIDDVQTGEREGAA